MQAEEEGLDRDDLHFGLFTRVPHRPGITQTEAFDDFFEIVRATEELSYDTIWIGEEHFAPGLWLSASNITLASAVAMRTTRVRVGLAIVALPLSHPLRVAEAAATVDQLSHGRLDFGGGRSTNTETYRRSDVSYAESKDRQEEALEVIKKAWTLERFSHRGKFYNLPDVSLSPKPYQKPHPPIYMAVVSPYSFPWAGRMGYDIFINPGGDRSRLLEMFDEYHNAWQEAGHPGKGKIVGSFLVYVADTEERAHSDPKEGTTELFHFQARLNAPLDGLSEEANRVRAERAHYLITTPYEEALRKDVILHYGTPESVVESLQQLRDDLGLSGFMLDMNCYNRLPPELTINSMQLFSREVIPRLKAAAPASA